MDNLTHSLFGLTLAHTPLRKAGRGVTATLVLASNAPDVDIVAAGGGLLQYLQWHRGPTHGALGVLGLGLLTAGLVYAGRTIVERRRPALDRTPPSADASLAALSIISVFAVFMHIAMDVPTSYGTRLLSPFAGDWYAADWMPIIDVYLWAILATGLAVGHMTQGSHVTATRARSRYAAIALGLMASYYGLRATAHHQALAAVPIAMDQGLPPPCDKALGSWTPLERWPSPAVRSDASASCLVGFAALPTFGSPFRWRLIAHLSDGYDVGDLDLMTPAAADHSGDSRRIRHDSDRQTPAVSAAARSDTAEIFLEFSRFPVIETSVVDNGETIVRWSDLRFADSPLWSWRSDGSGPLSIVVRVTLDGRVLEQRLGH